MTDETTADLSPAEIDLAEIRDKFILVSALDARIEELKKTMRDRKEEREQLLAEIQDIASNPDQGRLDFGKGE